MYKELIYNTVKAYITARKPCFLTRIQIENALSPCTLIFLNGPFLIVHLHVLRINDIQVFCFNNLRQQVVPAKKVLCYGIYIIWSFFRVEIYENSLIRHNTKSDVMHTNTVNSRQAALLLH